jgi:hypothetical protein
MIISASYKTDIPAFYGEWFVNRLRAGFCKMVNPYGRQVYTVDLRREAVEGFVFWTRNLGPFFPALNEVRGAGYPFVVQYTITHYPRALEPSVIDGERAVEQVRQLAGEYGPRVAVWRYDPVLFSSVTEVDFHRRNFERLAGSMEGATDEVVVSFAQIYRKTLRNLTAAAGAHGFSWHDPEEDEKRRLALELAQIARSHKMQLTVCSQRGYLVAGAGEASCIDAGRLSDVAGRSIGAKVQGNRPDCVCHQSRDIGDYDTCPHGCVYCYAVRNRSVAQRRFKGHDPRSEFLFSGSSSPQVSISPL